MLEKIISDGRSGAEQAAWRAARSYGISSDGRIPEATWTQGEPYREFTDHTEQNVLAADATLWFGETTTRGAQETVRACHQLAKPCMLVYPDASFDPSHVATWIQENKIRTLNVAGNQEEEEPGIGDRVERFLGEALERLGHVRA
jgi:Circularly permutated YpsA SLOG family